MAPPLPRVRPDVFRSGDAAALQAAEALVKALTAPEWLENRLRPSGRMTQPTLTALRAYAAVPEVRDYLTDLAQNGYRSKSRQWHYFKYKYEYNDHSLPPMNWMIVLRPYCPTPKRWFIKRRGAG